MRSQTKTLPPSSCMCIYCAFLSIWDLCAKALKQTNILKPAYSATTNRTEIYTVYIPHPPRYHTFPHHYQARIQSIKWSRQGLILILIDPKGTISWCIPRDGLMMSRHCLKLSRCPLGFGLGRLSGLGKSFGLWEYTTQYIHRLDSVRIQHMPYI